MLSACSLPPKDEVISFIFMGLATETIILLCFLMGKELENIAHFIFKKRKMIQKL